ncbi:MAG: hypothetical protein ACXACW_01465 [Candidatus Hodarchaeales archaeon]
MLLKQPSALLSLIVLSVMFSGFYLSNPLVASSSNEKYHIEYSTQHIWEGSLVTDALSFEDHLIWKNGSFDLILLKNRSQVHNYHFSSIISDVATLETGIVFTSNNLVYFLPYENFSNPLRVLNTTEDGEGMCALSLDAYHNYVYMYHPCQLFGGFNIYDFSNLHLLPVGVIHVSDFAKNVYIVNNYGFFEGSTASSIYYLWDNPINPANVWFGEFTGFNYLYLAKGRPAASDKYLHFFTNDPYLRNDIMNLFLLSNGSTLRNNARFPLPIKYNFYDSLFLNESFLVCSSTNDILTVFELSQHLTLELVSSIDLGLGDPITYLYLDDYRQELFFTTARGLYQMNLTITSPPATSPPPPSISWTINFSWFVILSMLFISIRRRE